MFKATRTRMKLPPSQSFGFSGWRTVPIASQICSTTFLFLKHSGMSCTCTQNDTVVMSEILTTIELLYLEITMMCLSKLQGLAARILSTSSLESKEKRIRWSPMNFILKPVFDLHRGLKVLAMVSRLIGGFMRNQADMENSVMAWTDFKVRPGPSFFDSERDFQWLDKSSMLESKGGRGGEEEKNVSL